ncbi:cell adhesion molecule Dscam1-like isoform X1 [Centruroides vittatus]|uniref:cell adhesion molecule Dscam1-like isoform X1 n=1 Tax=Centruroides vittatus TaxID=120091 RepID=UPI0035109B34
MEIFSLLLLIYYVSSLASSSVSIRRDTREGPKITSQPPLVVEFTNSTGSLVTCSARGNPTPIIRWIKTDGTDVTRIQGLRHVLSNGTLYFPPFSARSYRQDVHSTIIHCSASNSLGTVISTAIRLTAVVKQYYEVKVYDEFVIRGNTAVIRCHIPSFVKDYVTVIGWVKTSRNHVTTDITHGGRYSVYPSGQLHIRNVGSTDDFTSYRCRTRHRLTGETRLSDSQGRLVVTDPQNTFPPRITDSRSTIEGLLHQTVELPCAAQGLPIPKYRWHKVEGNVLTPILTGQRFEQLGGSLIIKDLRPDDDSKYVCVMRNNVGEERTQTRLVMSGHLTATIEPVVQTVDVGRSTIFNCTITGFPVHNVSWYFNGRPVPSNNHRLHTTWNVLRISSVSNEDEGMYQCFASNSHFSTQATSELKMGDITPKFIETFTEQTYQPGPSVSLKCIASGSPKPEISWTLDGNVIKRTGRVIVGDYVTSDGFVLSHVNISNVRVEDGGYYRCKATNGAGTILHQAKLNVFGLPFVRPFDNVTAVAMETLVVICRVAGHPIDSIHWEKDGRRLPFNHRQKIFSNGTMEIIQLDAATDTGIYTCIARNQQGQSAQGTLAINVRVPPLIERFYFAENLHEGMRTRVYCNIASGDLPISVTWLKDGESIPENLDVIVKDIDTYSVALAIEKLNPKHNGNYTCVASNAAATVNSTAQLVVNVLPHWIIEPVNTFVVQGNTVMLNCKADGYPTPQIVWKRASEKTATNFKQILSGPHFQVFENGTLRITDSLAEDAGYYLCQATNGIGAGLSTVIYLTVHVPAHFEDRPSNKTVGLSQETNLRCRAVGDKPMTIIWNKNGQPINMKSKVRYKLNEEITTNGMISELKLQTIQREDSALYSCLVTNAFGHDEITIRLIVQERPEPPQQVEANHKGSRHVTLSWKVPFDGRSTIIRYIVYFKNNSSPWPEGLSNFSVGGDQTSVIIHNLNPASTYNFRLFAENKIGQSEPSKTITVTTEEEIPGGPPTNVLVKALSSQSLDVTWEPPESRLQHGVIQGYYVGYKVHNSSEPYLYKTLGVTKNFQTKCKLDNLQKFTKYDILVQAYNMLGAGPRSDKIVAMTMEDVPSAPPQDVQCTPISSKSLYLRWSVPPLKSIHGILRGYKIIYKPVKVNKNQKEKLQKEIITTNVKINLDNLEKFTNYSIKTMALTRAGSGVSSDELFCSTKEDLPGRPQNIKVIVMAIDAILVSWMPPTNPNGILTEYNVFCRGYTLGRHNTTKVTLPPTQLFYEARELKRGQRYEFWVTASTSIGEGDPSLIVTQSTSQRAPARISSFSSQIIVNQRRNIELPCRAVGLPTPIRQWKLRGNPLLETERIHFLPTGTIRIINAKETDSGNYSCHVNNIYGSDEIYHNLLVEVNQESDHGPPIAPTPVIGSVTLSTITISWSNSIHTSVTGYEIYYKGNSNDWKHIRLPSLNTTYTIHDLICGSNYQIYIISVNEEGRSDPSNIVSARTKGGGPLPPKKEAFITSNITSITLHLEAWHNKGCPITSLNVEYRIHSNTDWITAAKELKPNHSPLILNDLKSETWYVVRVTARNHAGSNVAEYNVLTHSEFRGTIVPELIVHTDEPSPFSDMAVLIPVISSFIVLAAVLVTLIILCHRKKFTEAKYEDHSIKNDLTSDTSVHEKKQNHESSNRPLPIVFSSPVRKVVPFEDPFRKNISTCDDISPYATFHTPLSDRRLWQDRNGIISGCDRREVKETELFSITAQKQNCDARREENQGIAILEMEVPPINRGLQISKKSRGHLISKRPLKSCKNKEVGEGGEERTYAFNSSPSTGISHYEQTIGQDTARHKDHFNK